jgi:uncharacterized protein YaaN involved in tellurite resistance
MQTQAAPQAKGPDVGSLLAAKGDIEFVTPSSLALETEKEVLTPEDQALHAQAEEYVKKLVSIAPKDLETQQRYQDAVKNLGRDLIEKSAAQSAMLKQSISKLTKVDPNDKNNVGNVMLQFQHDLQKLDPTEIDFSQPGWAMAIAQKLPFVGSPISKYFAKWQSAEGVIDSYLTSFKQSEGQLERDNSIFAMDKLNLRKLDFALTDTIKMASIMDKKLTAHLATLSQDDPMYQYVQEELLFYLRKRIRRLTEQLNATKQAIASKLLVIRGNEIEMEACRDARELTILVLSTAVATALGLANQEIAFKKIEGVKEVTSGMMRRNAERLKVQTEAIAKQESEGMIKVDDLRASWNDLKSALDTWSKYRVEALPVLEAEIAQIDEMNTEGEKIIARIEQGSTARQELKIAVN